MNLLKPAEPKWANALEKSRPARRTMDSVYVHELSDIGEDGILAVSSVSCPRTDHRQMLYLTPEQLTMLDEHTRGQRQGRSGTILSLADWALRELKRQGKTLHSRNR